MTPRQVGEPTEESAPFWEATRNRRLVLQWCRTCERPIQYPRSFCPHCRGSALEWREASGLGTVYAVTVEHNPSATGQEDPYAIALVQLAEGARLMTNIVGAAPDDVHVGMSVTVTWEPLEDGRHLPLFQPAVSAAGR